MILCSCNRLSTSRVRAVLERQCQTDPYSLVTPGRLFAMTGNRMQCGRCARLVNEVIAKELRQIQGALPETSRPRKERPHER